jgi:hypothetical protein
MARWGVLGIKPSEERFLKSTLVPLFKEGDQDSIKKSKQVFVDFLLSQVPPARIDNYKSLLKLFLFQTIKRSILKTCSLYGKTLLFGAYKNLLLYTVI